MAKALSVLAAEKQIKKAAYASSGQQGLEFLKADGPSLRKLPQASAKDMELINKQPLIWASKEGCKSQPPKRKHLLDQMADAWESRFLSSEQVCDMADDFLYSFMDSEFHAWESMDDEPSFEAALGLVQQPGFRINSLLDAVEAIQEMNAQRESSLVM